MLLRAARRFPEGLRDRQQDKNAVPLFLSFEEIIKGEIMTVNKLHKLLSELIANGYGRREALVAKDSFSHPLESDGVTNLAIQGAKPKVIYIADGDGATVINADGTERIKSAVVLFGFDYLKDGNPPEPYVRMTNAEIAAQADGGGR